MTDWKNLKLFDKINSAFSVTETLELFSLAKFPKCHRFSMLILWHLTPPLEYQATECQTHSKKLKQIQCQRSHKKSEQTTKANGFQWNLFSHETGQCDVTLLETIGRLIKKDTFETFCGTEIHVRMSDFSFIKYPGSGWKKTIIEYNCCIMTLTDEIKTQKIKQKSSALVALHWITGIEAWLV